MTDKNHSQGHQNGGPDAEVHIQDPDTEVAPPSEPPSRAAVPDGGWGWMCVLGSAVGHVIFGVIIRAFGVTYLALLDRYGASATATAWVGALNFAGTGFLGPVVSILCRKFGCRSVTMVGGVLVAIGVITTGHAPNIYVTYVTYGLVTGLGLGLAYTPGYIIIGQYFDKRKALAMAIASFSSGIGALISPPLLVLLLREYGFTGMFLIIGGLCLNVCVGGALYRPLPTPADTKSASVEGEDSKKAVKDSDKITAGTDALGKETEQKSPMLQKQKESQPNNTDTFIKGEKNGLLGEDETDANSKSTQQPLTVSRSNSAMDQTQSAVSEKKVGLKARYIKLLKSPSFLGLTFAIFSLAFCLGLISGFLPALAVDNGVETGKAAWLLSISGICSMISTLTLGPVLDVPAVRRYRLHIYNLLNLLSAAATFLFAIVTSYAAYATLCVVVSACAGVLMSQRATVIGDIVGSGSDAEGFGIVLMIGAVGSLLGRSLAGSIKDALGGYNGAFYLSGTLALLSAVFLQAALVRRRMIHRNRERTAA